MPLFSKVEVLQGHRVVDVACGSGDAQTLCLTDDDTVWSWGDGDYGKLGRGGSDGCKVPMKVLLCLWQERASLLVRLGPQQGLCSSGHCAWGPSPQCVSRPASHASHG